MYNSLDFKQTVKPTDKSINLLPQLDAYTREHLKQALKTNGAQCDEEIAVSIKGLQDMLTKVT